MRKAIAVRFGSSERAYDYWCDFPVEKGQRVIVPTKRGEATVTVAEVREDSDKAQAAALRLAPDESP